MSFFLLKPFFYAFISGAKQKKILKQQNVLANQTSQTHSEITTMRFGALQCYTGTTESVASPHPDGHLSPQFLCRVCSGCGSGPHAARPTGRP